MIRCYFKSNANQAKVIHVEKLKPLEGALRNVPPAPDRCLNLQPGPETLAKKKKENRLHSLRHIPVFVNIIGLLLY